MTGLLYDLFKDFGMGHIAVIIVVLSLFIDLTPGIKWNPICYIAKKIGSAFNHSIDKKIEEFGKVTNQRIDEIEKRIEDIQKDTESNNELLQIQSRSIDVAEVNRLKKEILEFGNKLSHKQKFTIEEYRTIMDCYKRYHDIIDKYEDLENGKIDIEYELIVSHYKEHKDSGEYMF